MDLADAPVVERDRVGRAERHGDTRRGAGRGGTHLDALRREPMHQEPPPRQRLRIHGDIVDAHVEIGARHLDQGDA